jgi:hypothetical protein
VPTNNGVELRFNNNPEPMGKGETLALHRSKLIGGWVIPLLLVSTVPCEASPRPSRVRDIDFSADRAEIALTGVQATRTQYRGANALLLTVDRSNAVDDATFARLDGITARNFEIEAIVAGAPIDYTSDARGFVGVAFRISENSDQFDAIYVRPTNARAEDQLRRNHTTQYISRPGYPWEKLRGEHPGKYESYADMAAGEWTRLNIVVHEASAKLYINDAKEPALIVNDLKRPPASGGIGLWVGPGSLGYFKSVKIAVEQP